ncbi:FYVE-domain-containing protein [Trametes coccinea BRFM310]|uniref:FYVE-domain-containing protein n=1 Tax=Trametes coccinea (strain BRFM310) TaxID=1353009 RepID=A0A1Y2IJD5_TRAC3|nr:FYVE-domain-containing protein [Trametes coccinea BRFM310]
MIECTDPDDPEYTSLTAVHTLVSKITMSLNTSLHTHAQTLSLLALQRNTVNLPFQLITPGRTFLKRASLLQLEGSVPKEREFLLFSDCLIWLASADGDIFSDKWSAVASPSGSSTGGGILDRSRSRTGDADADMMKRRQSLLQLRFSGSPKKKVRQASSGVDDRWIYKGHVELVDLEVVVSVPSVNTPERGFELLSPHQSFAVYAATDEERDEWITAIRNAKSSLLVSLSVMQLNSTLTSSASNHHLRRTLQALPYAPDDVTKPRRGKVEHFVPAVWVPDGKTESCMRCGRTFGWRRRRHHCRLCGRCVCGSCSSKTFFIVDPNAKDSSKSARACEACYDTVFPLLEQPPESQVAVTAGTTHSHFTLSGLKSMPSLLLNDMTASTPSALMAIDIESPKRPLARIDDDDDASPADDLPAGPSVAAMRLKPAPRPKSCVEELPSVRARTGMTRRRRTASSASRRRTCPSGSRCRRAVLGLCIARSTDGGGTTACSDWKPQEKGMAGVPTERCLDRLH